MPRNSKRKTARGGLSEEAMLKAFEAVNAGMPFRTASKTLWLLAPLNIWEVKNLFLHRSRNLCSCFCVKAIKLPLAYQVALQNNIEHPFKNEKAGYDWLRGFRQRHPDITLRAPESTSTARARAFNKPVVDKFYSILKKVQEAKKIPPHRIYNVDETSVSTVPTKNTKVFAATGRKQVARVTSAERGDTTTMVVCMSASGTFVPPMFIFKRVRMKIELMDGAPRGSVWACNTSGWMKLDIFKQWFNHFLHHTKPSEDDPVLLILDGHLSHTKNLDVILKARENYVTIVCLPPHCTHKLQPLDVSVMYPLSIYHNQALENWMNNNPGRSVTVFQIAKIFGEAYLKAALPINAINGFSKTRIYPFNPDTFTEADFLAASITEMDLTDDPGILANPISVDSMTEPPLPTEFSPERDIEIMSNKTPTPVNEEQLSVRSVLSPLPSTSDALNRMSSPSILGDGQLEDFVVTPAQILPLPKIVGKRTNLKRNDESSRTGFP